ncbi:TIGR03086 family metal-binding protein [Amycolatopsis rubida]|uniref:TIGR03086 family protein n=1 Tax=Amycolatopsis rubida TaxID=112413 RepID=A0A1I5GF33_9PSEU|nr:TIGR03086 family metal-binding protein [Amycolatopsis rubida]SFO34161.1 TIGR03086 family protein [Amycolatopsis rubida]
MSNHSGLLAPAAAELRRVAAAAPSLTAPTACAEYDVRGLLNHLLYWGPWLAAAIRHEPYEPPAPSEAEASLVGDDWPKALEAMTDDVLAALAPPEAWTGTITFGSSELPAAVVGDLVLGELVVHAWDLARASGTELNCADEAAEAVLAFAAEMGEGARARGVFGPAVAVPKTAPVLHRALGATGRDPYA